MFCGRHEFRDEGTGGAGGQSFPPLLIFWQISNPIGGQAHYDNHNATRPSYFQTFLRPFELLLAWFVDVAIQFVMLSQYGRG